MEPRKFEIVLLNRPTDGHRYREFKDASLDALSEKYGVNMMSRISENNPTWHTKDLISRLRRGAHHGYDVELLFVYFVNAPHPLWVEVMIDAEAHEIVKHALTMPHVCSTFVFLRQDDKCAYILNSDMHCFKDYKPELTIRAAYNLRVSNSMVFSNEGAKGMFTMLRYEKPQAVHKDEAHPLIEEVNDYELLLASTYSPYVAQTVLL
jgi:hypothetical protein